MNNLHQGAAAVSCWTEGGDAVFVSVDNPAMPEIPEEAVRLAAAAIHANWEEDDSPAWRQTCVDDAREALEAAWPAIERAFQRGGKHG